MKISIWGMTLFVFATLFNIISCQEKELAEEEIIELRADSFGIAYFNWQYTEAIKWVTPESEKWIRYAASNVTQTDVDSLTSKEYGTNVTVEAINFDTDTTITVLYRIENYLNPKHIGEISQFLPYGECEIKLKNHQGKWLVHMPDRLPDIIEP